MKLDKINWDAFGASWSTNASSVHVSTAVRRFATRLPPAGSRMFEHEPTEGDASHAVQSAWGALIEYDHHSAAIRRDKRLSAFGQAERLEPLLGQARTKIERAKKSMVTQRAGLAAHRGQGYQVAPLPPGDAMAFAQEAEHRTVLRGLSKGAAMKLILENEAALLAASRDKLNPELANFALSRWRESVDARHPEQKARFALAEQELDWAEVAVAMAETVIAREVAKEFQTQGIAKGVPPA